MKLMTKAIEKKIPALYAQEKLGEEAIAYVKFFTPDSNWTWYATEYNPETREFFGLIKGFETELGYFQLEELECYKGPMGLHIERDLYFEPTKIAILRG